VNATKGKRQFYDIGALRYSGVLPFVTIGGSASG
jgi:hypothetical protein